jgi:histidinol dehydrogenase
MDIKHLIGEIAARHHMRVEADDPVFALVTANELILQEAGERSEAQLRAALAEFIDTAEKLETDAGRVLASQIKQAAAQARQSFRNDITAASAQLRETLHKISAEQTQPSMIRWAAVGLLCGTLLFTCGVIVGKAGLIP